MASEEVTIKSLRKEIYVRLHDAYRLREYDNTDVWAGNMKIDIDGVESGKPLTRVFIDTDDPDSKCVARVSAEFYIRGITDRRALEDKDIDARLWTDANRHGFVDQKGIHYPDFGHLVPMSLAKDEDGNPILKGNNAVFVSDPFEITKTGVFSYTVEFSADEEGLDDRGKAWVSVNDIAHNTDGIIAVSPMQVRDCPSIMEICVRKYGAGIENGRFISGKFKNVTKDIANIPVDILYLLPIFEPGTGDSLTGGDVRKGELGSIYAVKDFFKLDPELCSDPAEADFHDCITRGLIVNYDLLEVLDERHSAELTNVSDFGRFRTGRDVVDYIGRESATQLVGRAELRELVDAAHAAGKRVIFDLVLMQTSRDSDLIKQHLDWYELDENGAPKKHSIAWLDYSDVALFRLMYNRPLQNYLSSVAPYWIRACKLDGVRIDASQTVDRVFLKQIKNRINELKPDALVLGETLCPMHEAVDIPTDIIYSLLVDHHVHIERATPYFDLFETYHNMFPHGTHTMSYFENHDSLRATTQWLERYSGLLSGSEQARAAWAALEGADTDGPAGTMAALKNIQCSIINMISGAADAVNFCYSIENGTDYGETVRTDFENKILLDFSLREKGAHKLLHDSYVNLHRQKKNLGLVCNGHVFYMRNNLEPGQDDRVLALVRHLEDDRVIFLANLDPVCTVKSRFAIDFLDLKRDNKYSLEAIFDTYGEFGLKGIKPRTTATGADLADGKLCFDLKPLQSVIISF